MKEKSVSLIVFSVVIIFFTLLFLLLAYCKVTGLEEVSVIKSARAQVDLDDPNLSGIPYITKDGEKAPKMQSRAVEVSFYSAIDSCHTGSTCLMANGAKAHIGAVACPRSIPLGTLVRLGGHQYSCEDRTARWVDGRFDIFMGYGEAAYKQALENGIQFLTLTIL